MPLGGYIGAFERAGEAGRRDAPSIGRRAPQRRRVRIGGKRWHRDLRWILATAVLATAAAGFYVAESLAAGRLQGGSSRTGFVCGLAAGAIVIFELLLWPRRRVRSWRLGSAQAWLRAHVWLGLLSLPLAVMHARLLFIGGWLNWTLMGLFLVVIASGVWGLVVQQFIPTWMLEEIPAETIHEQIGHVAAQQCREAERLVRGTCVLPSDGEGDRGAGGHAADESAPDERSDADERAVVTALRSMTGIQGKVLEVVPIYAVIPGTAPIGRFFLDEVRPYLLDGSASGSGLASRVASQRLFTALRDATPTEAASVIDHLERACDIRRQFDLQSRLHGWLHGWLLVHVPLSAALGVLLAIHVPVALWYW